MRHAAEALFLRLIGAINVVVFRVTRGRVVPYRFRGLPGFELRCTGPDAPAGSAMMACCLPDGDGYVLVTMPAGVGRFAGLARSDMVTAELEPGQHVPMDVVMITDAEGAPMLARALRNVSIHERHQALRHGLVPVARITPHWRPRPSPGAFSGLMEPG